MSEAEEQGRAEQFRAMTRRKAKRPVRIADIRRAVADYMATEGCSCCQDVDGHRRAAQDSAVRRRERVRIPQV